MSRWEVAQIIGGMTFLAVWLSAFLLMLPLFAFAFRAGFFAIGRRTGLAEQSAMLSTAMSQTGHYLSQSRYGRFVNRLLIGTTVLVFVSIGAFIWALIGDRA